MLRKIQRFFKQNSWAYILLVIPAYFLYKKVKKIGNDTANAIKNSAMAASIKDAMNQANISDVRAGLIVDIANNIYDAFYKDSLFGLGEDEVKAMENFKMLNSVDEAIACAVVYRASFSKSLYQNIMQYCHFTDFDDVKQGFLNAIVSK